MMMGDPHGDVIDQMTHVPATAGTVSSPHLLLYQTTCTTQYLAPGSLEIDGSHAPLLS